MQTEQINTLNKVLAIIDSKASDYKKNVFQLSSVQRAAEKKILFDLIKDGMDIANSIQPPPPEIHNVILDLKELSRQLNDMP